MKPLSLQDLDRLDELLSDGTVFSTASPQAIGETSASQGLWRFFSNSWPQGGISGWNTGSQWVSFWRPFLPPGLFSFGEDVFGNQLILTTDCQNVLLWNHENGECNDLLVPPPELLRTVLQNGLEWIDFYSDGSPATAREFGAVPLDMHLHWTTPLILGGQVAHNNILLVERQAHLVGHAKLWSQIARLDILPATRCDTAGVWPAV
jgi:hypothetical protein